MKLFKRMPTEEQMKRFVKSIGGVYAGCFPHPLIDHDDYERFYALKTPRNMLFVEAVWHRRKSFVYFIKCAFPEKRSASPDYSIGESGVVTSKKPGVADRKASRKAKAEKV